MRLTDADVQDVRLDTRPQEVVAREKHTSRTTICKIQHGETHKKLPWPAYLKPKGHRNPPTAPHIVRAIRKDPRSVREIAAEYQLSIGLVSMIKTRKVWKDVSDD